MFKSGMAVVSLAVLLSSGCIPIILTGSGNVVSQEEDIADFDKVDISNSFEVSISQGASFRVILRIDDNLVKHLQVVKQGDMLKIGLKPNRDYTIRDATMEAEVTMPELAGLDMSGGSHATITGFKSARALAVDMSGGSHLQGDIEAGDATFDLSGSSEVILTGSAQNVMIKASGSSEVDLADFSVVDANVDLSGSSEATVNPSGRLDADASGASRVYYLGTPTLGKMDTSGSSSIEQK